MMRTDSNYVIKLPPPVPNKSLSAQSLLRQDYVHSGYLRKLNPSKVLNWTGSQRVQYFVVLCGGCVYYYDNDTSKSAKGVFSLLKYNVINRCRNLENSRQLWVFQIIYADTSGTTQIFSASSEKDMQLWMKFIKEEMSRVNSQSRETVTAAGQLMSCSNQRDAGDGQESLFNLTESLPRSPSQSHNKDDTQGTCFFSQQPNRNSSGNCSVDDDVFLTVPDNQTGKSSSPCPTHDSDQGLQNSPCTPSESGAPKVITPSRTQSFLNIIRKRRLSVPKLPPILPNIEQLEEAECLKRDLQLSTSQSTGALDTLTDIQRTSPIGESRDDVPAPAVPVRLKISKSEINSHDVITPVSDSNNVTELEGDALSSSVPDVWSQPTQPTHSYSYWEKAFMDDLDKDQAAQKLRELGQEGVYIVRNSDSAFKVLTLYNQGRIRKLKMFQDDENGKYFFVKEHEFDSMEDLLLHYSNLDIPNIGMKLSEPYLVAVARTNESGGCDTNLAAVTRTNEPGGCDTN